MRWVHNEHPANWLLLCRTIREPMSYQTTFQRKLSLKQNLRVLMNPCAYRITVLDNPEPSSSPLSFVGAAAPRSSGQQPGARSGFAKPAPVSLAALEHAQILFPASGSSDFNWLNDVFLFQPSLRVLPQIQFKAGRATISCPAILERDISK